MKLDQQELASIRTYTPPQMSRIHNLLDTIAERDAQIAELREQLANFKHAAGIADGLLACAKADAAEADLRVAAAYNRCYHILLARCVNLATESGSPDITESESGELVERSKQWQSAANHVMSHTPASAREALDAHDRKIAETSFNAGVQYSMGDGRFQTPEELVAQCKAGGGQP